MALLLLGVILSLLVLAVILTRHEHLDTPLGFGVTGIAIAAVVICLRSVPRGSRQEERGLPVLAATLGAAVTVLSIWAQLPTLDRPLQHPVAIASEGGAPGADSAVLPDAEAVAALPDAASSNGQPAMAADPLEADRLARAQILGTLVYVLSETRSEAALWPTTLATTSDGRVFDPLSATPGHVLAWLPPGSTLYYWVSPDRLHATMRLTGADPAARDMIYDSTVGTVTDG